MYVFGSSRKLLLSTSEASSLKDAIFVFEGEFTQDADKHKIVDTMLGLWSIVNLRKESLDEVNLIYSKIIVNRDRVFPKEFCGELPRLLEEQLEESGETNSQQQQERARVRRGSNISRQLSMNIGKIMEDESNALADAGDFAHAAADVSPATVPPATSAAPPLPPPWKACAEDEGLQLTTPTRFERPQKVTPFGPAQTQLIAASAPWDLMLPLPANLIAELTLLATLCNADVASAETVHLAASWCEHNGMRSIEDLLVDGAMVDDFVLALDLKAYPTKQLLAVLRTGTCEVATAMRALRALHAQRHAQAAQERDQLSDLLRRLLQTSEGAPDGRLLSGESLDAQSQRLLEQLRVEAGVSVSSASLRTPPLQIEHAAPAPPASSGGLETCDSDRAGTTFPGASPVPATEDPPAMTPSRGASRSAMLAMIQSAAEKNVASPPFRSDYSSPRSSSIRWLGSAESSDSKVTVDSNLRRMDKDLRT